MVPDDQHPPSTIGALTESIRQLNKTMESLRQEMMATYVRKDVLEPQLKAMQNDIDKHAGFWDWLIKIVLGAVILALLGLVISQGGLK